MLEEHIYLDMPPHTDTNSDCSTSTDHVEQYHIREMTITDLPLVVPIDQATWGDHSWSIDDFLSVITDSFHSCWILECLEHDYPIVGYGFQRSSNGVSHITNLCLHPNHRGRGLGEYLLRHMINHARYLHIPKVELQVSTCNIRAYTLYVKHGFTVCYLLEHYYSDGDDAYQMELFIAN